MKSIDPHSGKTDTDSAQIEFSARMRILVVDDEPKHLHQMQRFLEPLGHEVLSAVDGLWALECLERESSIDVVISDVLMPGIDGIRFLERAKQVSPRTLRILLTAFSDSETLGNAINRAGVFRFLSKPVKFDEVLKALHECKQYNRSFPAAGDGNPLTKTDAPLIWPGMPQPPVDEGTAGINVGVACFQKKDGDARQVDLFDMVYALSSTLDMIDPRLANHHKQSAYVAVSIAHEMGLAQEEIAQVFMAAILHDIGAIAMPDRSRLFEEDVDDPHKHGEAGAVLLSSFSPFAPLAQIVRRHHVAWNHGEGAGFQGQKSTLIPHIVHLADRMVIQIDRRMPVLKLSRQIRENIHGRAGKTFAPDCVAAFDQLAVKEAFWFDLTSNALDGILRDISELPTIKLDGSALEEFSDFFSIIIDTRSPYTASHSAGVAACAAEAAKRMGLPDGECRKIRIAGYLHDLGKLAIPERILEKPGRLDRDEEQAVKAHSYHTFTVLKRIGGLGEIADYASLHHEKLNGAGYPFHRVGESIPLGARIVTVADVFAALSEDRPYREGLAAEKITAVLKSMMRQGETDAAVTETFLSHFDEMARTRQNAQERRTQTLRPYWEKLFGLRGA